MKHLKRILFSFLISSVIAFIMILSLELCFGGFERSESDAIFLNDFSFEELSEGAIVSTPDSYKSFMARRNDFGSFSSNDSPEYIECDKDIYEYSAKRITGLITVHATESNERANLIINAELKSGELRLFLICDGEIIERVDIKDSIELSYEIDAGHSYIVRVLCNKANMKVLTVREWNE